METLTRDDYAKVGLDLLAEAGISGVTVATACARLGVTKGSFYHHFDGVGGLRQAMLEYWEDQHARVRPSALDGLPPQQRLDRLIDATVDRSHEVESAVRAWARTDPEAAATQRRLDALRVEYVATTLEECGVPRRRSLVVARMGLAMLIGYQSLGGPVDRPALRAATEEWRVHLHDVMAEETAAPARGRSGGPAA